MKKKSATLATDPRCERVSDFWMRTYPHIINNFQIKYVPYYRATLHYCCTRNVFISVPANVVKKNYFHFRAWICVGERNKFIFKKGYCSGVGNGFCKKKKNICRKIIKDFFFTSPVKNRTRPAVSCSDWRLKYLLYTT